jgi:PAS domain S-box-containing protein
MAELISSGTSFFAPDSLAPYDRTVDGEETYLTYSYTPILGETGAVEGVLCIFIETTDQVLSRRRGRMMTELGRHLATSVDQSTLLVGALDVLSTNPDDHPSAAVVQVSPGGTAAVLHAHGSRRDDEWLALARAAATSVEPTHAGVAVGDGQQGVDGAWHAYPLRGGGQGEDALVLVLSHHRQRPFDPDMDSYFRLAASIISSSLTALEARAAAQNAVANARVADLSWKAAVLHAMHDPLVIFDHTGTVIDVNQAFTDLLGYSLADGPFRPPYPWWPTIEEDADALAQITGLHSGLLAHPTNVDTELCFYARDRRPVWVETLGSFVANEADGSVLHIRTLHDVTRNRDAQQRRAAAASLSAEFGTVEDLATLLSVAEHAYAHLFDGTSTIQLDTAVDQFAGSRGPLTAAELDPTVHAGISGVRNPDTKQLRPGILLTHQGVAVTARAWIQFPRPRRITADEMIVADLLAQAFAYAVDRIHVATKSAERHHNLEMALESHRLIGQAVGILVERHRILPAQAFDRLRVVSQNRNQKLRDLAQRVIETGAEPEEA